MKKIIFALFLMLSSLALATDWDSTAALKRVNTIGTKILKANNINHTIEFKVSAEDAVNAYANIDKEIYIQFFINPTTKKPDKDLHIFVKGNNHEFIEMKYINPRKKINKNFNNLTKEENERLRLFLNTCGKDLLEYQHKKINFEEITRRLSNVFKSNS